MTDNTKIAEPSLPLSHLIDFFCFRGQPENLDEDHEVTLLVNHGYLLGFSSFRKQPLWAAYRVAEAREDVDYERPHLFYDDKRLASEDRIGSESFGKVDEVRYDRGHLVPNFAINTQFGRLAQLETFFMSNIAPQAANMNRGVWQTLEKRIIREYAAALDHVWVYTGPIFGENPQFITRPNGMQVPIAESFFAILVDPFRYPHDEVRNVRFLALEIPQSAGYVALDEQDFSVTITSIEERTKLNFFPDLSESDREDVEETIWDSWQ